MTGSGETAQQDPVQEFGLKALAAFECLIDEKNPIGSYEPIADAVRCLVRLRDHLIEERRSGGTLKCQQRLDQVNSILSLASGAEYPMVGVRWERIEMTCDSLRKLLAESQA